ncbi:MAG: recombination mediator RecR [Tissierellia bacterium]|nr:recombination mediator RecR [Tissierellia bacterium]
MYSYPETLELLIEELRRLPSIGRKSAQRMALHIVGMKDNKIDNLIQALDAVKTNIHTCELCGNLTEDDICPICLSDKRDKTILCVVEDVTNLITIEKSESFNGLYHVLSGLISPSGSVMPDDIGVDKFIERLKDGKIKEIIFAISPTVEGETTMLFLSELIKDLDIKITRIASGIPVGGNLEYYDDLTLSKALKERIDLRKL